MRFVLLVLVGFANACSSSSKSTSTTDGGSTTTSTISTATATSTTTTTSTSDTGLTLYGTPYAHVNMWYGPVTYVPGITNACASEPTEIYPTVIQNLYGDYIIGLDGVNIPNVASHCDQCAQLTANGISIVAHIVTYGTENGVDAIDLSPQAQSALGLSSSDWTGTWQFSSCPTTAPVYYEFDARQWSPQNFWYVRVWVRNSRLPIRTVETNVANGGWVATSQQSDGAWQSESGVDFSKGLQIRVTATNNEQLVDTLPTLTSMDASNPVEGRANFP